MNNEKLEKANKIDKKIEKTQVIIEKLSCPSVLCGDKEMVGGNGFRGIRVKNTSGFIDFHVETNDNNECISCAYESSKEKIKLLMTIFMDGVRNIYKKEFEMLKKEFDEL